MDNSTNVPPIEDKEEPIFEQSTGKPANFTEYATKEIL